MKERPILFKSEMVNAILDGRKTMTRRIVKNNPNFVHWNPIVLKGYGGYCDDHGNPVRCPYGTEGDILWVREEHYRMGYWKKNGFTKSGKQARKFVHDSSESVLYSDNPPKTFRVSQDKENPLVHQWYKRLARFMPRAACRIRLEITDIEVERVQEISEEDAKAEGVKDSMSPDDLKNLKGLDWIITRPFREHQFSFLALWCKINGTKSWESNPWVWAISFKRI